MNKKLCNYNIGKKLNRHFPKDLQVANGFIKMYSTSLVIREMETKITLSTMRYYLTPV